MMLAEHQHGKDLGLRSGRRSVVARDAHVRDAALLRLPPRLGQEVDHSALQRDADLDRRAVRCRESKRHAGLSQCGRRDLTKNLRGALVPRWPAPQRQTSIGLERSLDPCLRSTRPSHRHAHLGAGHVVPQAAAGIDADAGEPARAHHQMQSVDRDRFAEGDGPVDLRSIGDWLHASGHDLARQQIGQLVRQRRVARSSQCHLSQAQRHVLQLVLPGAQIAAQCGEGGLLVLPVREVRGQQSIEAGGQHQHADQHEQDLALDAGHHGR